MWLEVWERVWVGRGIDGVLGAPGSVGFGIGDSGGFVFLGFRCSSSGMAIGPLSFFIVLGIVLAN